MFPYVADVRIEDGRLTIEKRILVIDDGRAFTLPAESDQDKANANHLGGLMEKKPKGYCGGGYIPLEPVEDGLTEILGKPLEDDLPEWKPLPIRAKRTKKGKG